MVKKIGSGRARGGRGPQAASVAICTEEGAAGTWTPAGSVAEVLDRFASMYPGVLDGPTLRRIEETALKARPISMSDERGVLTPTRQDLGVAGALLKDHTGITAAGLAPILGRPVYWCDVQQRRGRMWVQAYENAVARREARLLAQRQAVARGSAR